MLIISLIGFIIFIFSTYLYFTAANPKNSDVICTDIRVFQPLDSLSTKFTSDQIFDHNSRVISTLQERESTTYNLRMSRESNIKQARTIYIAILVVLLTLLFNKKKEDVGLNFKFILLTFAILVFYLVEVHSEDLLQRQDNCTQIISRSTEEIVNSTRLNSTWFELNYSNYLTQIYEATEGSFYRKLMKATHPDIEQIGIYAFPYLLIIISFIISSFRQLRKNYN